MATVYLATDLRRQRTVALKVLRPELASLIGPQRFLREIEISGKLNHPNILALFDAGEADGLPYFVMPFIEGESLRVLLDREGQLSIEDALRITRQVADGLSYAHAQGIIHRDIKPENLLLSSGHALVADFGIARAVSAGGTDKLTGTGMAIGTADYMSPEQATGTGQVDARSDLYSLGCVLYEMLAGGPPFAGGTAQAVLARHLVDPVPPIRTVRRTVPVQVEAAILAALAKSKADRFGNVKEFIEALDGKRPSPSQPYPAAADPRAQRRRRVLFAVGLGAIVLTAVAGYVALRPPALDDTRVLVAPFEDRTGDPSLSGLAAQAATEIVSGLASIGMVQPVDARSVAPEAGRARDLPSLRRLARGAGARSVVSGTIERRGTSVEFQIHLTDAATGDVLRPVRPVVWPAVEPTAAAAQVAQRVMAGYATHFDPRFHNYATISQPATYDAYREFRTGVRVGWEDEDSRPAAALDHFHRAIALDSAFTAPRIWVAFMHTLLGECRVTDSVAAAFQTAGARLLSSDQARIDSHVASCHGDPRGKYAAAQQLFRDAPELAENVTTLAFAAWTHNKPREVLTCLERLERTRQPASGRAYCGNLMIHAYHQLGQFREALQLTDRMRAEFPDDPLLERYQMRQWAALGDVERVNALIDQRLTKGSQEVLAGEDVLWIGEELRGHGQLAAGRALCERGVAWYGTRPSSQQATFDARMYVARLLFCAERWDQARVAYQRLAAEDSNETGWQSGIYFRARLGALAARRGDSAEVARIDRWFAARDSLPRASCGRAVLAGFRGDRASALAFFQFAWERGQPDFAEAHADPLLEPLRDYPPIRALIYEAR